MTHEFFPFRGGAARLVHETAVALASIGQATEVWAPDYGKMHTAADAVEPFCTVRWRNTGNLAPWSIWKLASDLAHASRTRRPWRMALASVGAIRAALWVRLLWPSRLPGRVTVVHHGSEILKFSRSAFWSGQLRRAFGAGWIPACTTAAVEKTLRQTDWIASARPVVRLPCALPASIREAALAAPAVAGEGKFRLLTLARLHPRKGQLDLARALALLPAEMKSRMCWVLGGAGDPAYRAEVLAAARTAQVEVEDLGEVREADLPAVYRSCSAYAMASRSLPDSIEGFGLTYLEAGAFGLPVVGTRTGGVAEAIEDRVTGLLVSEEHSAELAAALERLWREPDLARQLGAAGRARALASNWREAAENLLGSRIL